ncbi:MAG TPA: hypothetical protein VEO56_03000 [Bacteroidota bacterium]|nr:hypothetical protein [Bacteroidota bacterium]
MAEFLKVTIQSRRDSSAIISAQHDFLAKTLNLEYVISIGRRNNLNGEFSSVRGDNAINQIQGRLFY